MRLATDCADSTSSISVPSWRRYRAAPRSGNPVGWKRDPCSGAKRARISSLEAEGRSKFVTGGAPLGLVRARTGSWLKTVETSFASADVEFGARAETPGQQQCDVRVDDSPQLVPLEISNRWFGAVELPDV